MTVIDAAWEGTWNARDAATLGGIRPGLVWRSATLAGLTPSGGEALVRAGVRRVIDLRTPQEQEANGADLVPAVVRVATVPVHARASLNGLDVGAVPDNTGHPVARLAEVFSKGKTGVNGRLYMERTYRAYLQDPDAAAALGEVARLVAEADDPVVIHCAGGKDRTGVAVALLEWAAGSDRDAVYADYLWSRHAIAWNRQAMRIPAGVDPDVMTPMLRAEPSYLEAAEDEMRRRYGDVMGFLEEVGVGHAARARLTDRLRA